MINLLDYPEIIKTVNAIVNDRGVAEVKLEKNGTEIVVVEITRQIKAKNEK